MCGDVLQRERRRELGLDRLLALVHLGLGLADHLDVPHRVLVLVVPEVEVVHAEGLLEDRGVRLLRQGQHRLAVVEHVVAPDLIRRVGQAVRMLVVRRRQQQLGRVGRAARDDDHVAGHGLGRAVSLDHDLGHGRAVRVRVQPNRLGVGEQGDVRRLEGRANAHHLGVGLRVQRAREAVAVAAADADARSAGCPRPAARRRARGRGGGRRRRDRRTVAGSGARAAAPGKGRARSRAVRSGPRPGRRGPDRAPRPSCSTAPCRRSRSATRGRSRRDT